MEAMVINLPFKRKQSNLDEEEQEDFQPDHQMLEEILEHPNPSTQDMNYVI